MNGALYAVALAACGAAAVAAADIWRAFARGFCAKGFIGGITDLLSVVSAGCAVWYGIEVLAHGEMRVCVLICIAAGSIMYIMTVKKIFFAAFCFIFKNIFKFLHFIFKILLTPARFLYKIICVCIHTKNAAENRRNGESTNVQAN